MRRNAISLCFGAALIALGAGAVACEQILDPGELQVLPAKNPAPTGPFKAPEDIWDTAWPGAVLYYIVVDRFHDGDPDNNGPSGPTTAYRGGDWKGIIDKIEKGYFQNLGVNTLWLSVPIDNVDDVHGDEAADEGYASHPMSGLKSMDKLEERFGTEDDFRALVKAAHSKGLKVIVDYMPNHVHVSSSVYHDRPGWFWPLKQEYNGKTEDRLCGTGEDPDPQRRRCWFSPSLPDFNFNIKAARDFSVSNAVEWIKSTDIDGYNIVAAQHIERTWSLQFRSVVAADVEPLTKRRFLALGQSFSRDRSVVKESVVPGWALDGQLDFPLRSAIVAAALRRSRTMTELADFMRSQPAGFYSNGLMCNFLGAVDLPRVIHHAEDQPRWEDEWATGGEAGEEPAKLPETIEPFERLTGAYTILFTLPGIPALYFGDEIALPDAGDPKNPGMMSWDARTEGQKLVLDHVKEVAQIRQDHIALRRGRLTVLGDTDDVLTYEMKHDEEILYVVVNRGNESSQVAPGLPEGGPEGGVYEYVDLLTDTSYKGDVSIPPRSSMILRR